MILAYVANSINCLFCAICSKGWICKWKVVISVITLRLVKMIVVVGVRLR